MVQESPNTNYILLAKNHKKSPPETGRAIIEQKVKCLKIY